jgi:exonuclease SbcD
MRILHTSDWHLNERLKGIERQPDIIARMEEIAGYLDEYHVDVMVVSGDIFSQTTRMSELKRAMDDVHRVFKPFLLRGGTIVALSGNHDNEDFFSLLRTTLDLAAPVNSRQIGPRPGGRLYMFSQPGILELADKAGQSVQFVLLPYPTVARYLKDGNITYSSLAERNQKLHDKFKERLQEIQEKYLNPHLPSVLVAHIHVRGSEIHTPHHLSESDDVIYEQGEIPAYWAYIAYGHIHKPQRISNASYMRYAGSIERLNYGERDDQKSVVLVDIGQHGRQGDPICLPLNATPFYHVELLNPESDMQNLRELYPDADRALVSCRLVYKPGVHDVSRLTDELRGIFPRCYDLKIEVEGTVTPTDKFESSAPSRDVSETVENYVQEQLADHQDREEVLKLTRELLATVE